MPSRAGQLFPQRLFELAVQRLHQRVVVLFVPRAAGAQYERQKRPVAVCVVCTARSFRGAFEYPLPEASAPPVIEPEHRARQRHFCGVRGVDGPDRLEAVLFELAGNRRGTFDLPEKTRCVLRGDGEDEVIELFAMNRQV